MLENKSTGCLKFYEVLDCGCGYEKLLGIFDDKQHAIAFWEEKTHKDFSEHNTLIKECDKNHERHWYYEVKETCGLSRPEFKKS